MRTGLSNFTIGAVGLLKTNKEIFELILKTSDKDPKAYYAIAEDDVLFKNSRENNIKELKEIETFFINNQQKSAIYLS